MEKAIPVECIVSGSSSVTLEDVYSTYRKWFYIEDTNRIDVGLAVAINQKVSGLPLWIF